MIRTRNQRISKSTAMENKINITAAISNCPRTGLPRVARWDSTSHHANGSIQVHYYEDVLDNEGEVFQKGTELKSVEHFGYPISTPEGTVETTITPELEAMRDANIPLIQDVLSAIDPPAKKGGK